jgi:outer membrane protein assembly factor BamA
MDIGDFIRWVTKQPKAEVVDTVQPKAAILPSIGYNPSMGFVLGAKISGVVQYGSPENTNLSSFGIEAQITTKEIRTAQVRHNIFRKGNEWNLQGNWQISKYLISDYGDGPGSDQYLTNSDSLFPIRFQFLRLTERVYRRIAPNLYLGVGMTFNFRWSIDDEKLDDLGTTPHERYSLRNEIDSKKYNSNGWLLGFQYNTRDHPLRAYKGTYFEVFVRFNPTWLGSTKESWQLAYDFRKYFSLSSNRPEHVLAFWHTASYRLGGTIPYLEMPATGYDAYNRSGRGYTIGRFKGPSSAYFELEYRFPILHNKLVSGVTFVNAQSVSSDQGVKIFQFWEPAAGAGLRFLLQKQSRSTICFDYAVGKYGSNGFFFGLNEVF